MRRFVCVAAWLGLTLMASAARAEEQAGHRLLAADYSTKRIGIVDEAGKLVWEHPVRDIHDAWVLPNGNILFQTDWTHIVEMTPEKKIVWQYDAGQQNGNAGKAVEVHAFQRLPDGKTMIAESGVGRIIEVDAEGKLTHQIALKREHPDTHRDTRLARKLANGHYLVAQEGDLTVREYDGDGKVVWEHKVGSRLYSAERLANGHTLLGTGDGHSVIEIDRDGREVWKVGEKDLPGIQLHWVTMVARQANGNTVIVNCHAGKENPQVIIVSHDKKVVWTFKDFEHFGNSLPVGKILR
jgi:outer membrane protein assembly factor BamB